jgi:hypothetical protein
MCWMLLIIAIGLSYELDVFDNIKFELLPLHSPLLKQSTQHLALIIIPWVKGLEEEIQKVEDEVLGELRFCACTGSPIRVPCITPRAEFSNWPPVSVLHWC